MLPPRIESTRTRRRRHGKLWFALLLLALLSFLGYRYGEDAYVAVRQRFLPENLQLLESRASHIDARLDSHAKTAEGLTLPGYTAFDDEEHENLVSYLEDSRRILRLYEGSSETGAALQANAALFQFYELLLYLQLDEKSILQLAGRGFLPPLKRIDADAFRSKARSTLLLVRKSLAMDPTQRRADDLHLIELLADLLYNERTDPYLFEQLEAIAPEKITPGLQPAYRFAALSLFALSGNKDRLNRVLAEENLHLGTETRELLQIFTFFHARDFIRAMQLTRALMLNPQVAAPVRSEAYRMMAEIFRIQSGPAAGLPYLYRARELHPDPFLDELIQQWQGTRP